MKLECVSEGQWQPERVSEEQLVTRTRKRGTFPVKPHSRRSLAYAFGLP